MSEQFCLRWNNHQSTLISVFETLLESGSLIDCTLCAEGQLLKAHKVVLSACSPIFESMLCIQEDKHPIIFLKDVKFIELKAMLDYMYKGEVNILQDQLDSFLRTAAALQIKGLTDQGGGGGDEPPAKKGPGRKTGMSDVAPESPLVGNAPLREGSVSPTRRRRRIPRRPSSAEDASADNSCDIPPPAVAPPAITPATGALPVSEPLHRSSLSATTVKAKQEPIDTPLVTPKQEFVEETNEEIEDLTLDDDDDYNDSMSDMSKPGTSFGAMNPGSTSQQDFSQWQQMMGAADRSGTDEVFMAAQEAINNQTNTQGRSKKKDKKTSDEPVMSSEDDLTGTGSSGFEITVIQAGNGKLYSDGNGHFYRISKHCVAEGDVRVSFMRCTYETCKGQAVMRRKGNNITLYPENVHTCEPNTFFQNVTALRETILHRCKQERRKGLKNIFMEETSSYELSAAVRAALSYETLLSSMEEARAKNKKPLKPTPAKTVESASKKRPKPTTPKEKTENVTEYVYINEDGTLEDSEYIDEDELLKDCASDDDEEKEVKTKCIIVTPKTETITVVKPGKTIHKPRVDLGPGLPALKIPGRKGSASIYTDGNDYFYRKGRHTVLKGDLDTWYMSCTYQDCQGKAIMQERDSVLMLYHRNSHSCEPIPCLADLIDIKQKIMERCKTDPITPLKQIFEEETMSPEYAPEIGALLSFQSMEAAMQRARKLSIRSKKWSSENLD